MKHFRWLPILAIVLLQPASAGAEPGRDSSHVLTAMKSVRLIGVGAQDEAVSRQLMPGTEPDTVVRRYYALIDSRQFPAAWALLGDRQRDSLDYDQWVGGHVSTRSVQTPAVTILARSDGVATVAVTIIAVDADGAGTVTRRFTGTWALIADGGEWKLDSPDIRLVDESRSVPADPSLPALAVPEPPVPPQSQPASASLDFDPSPYVNKGDAYNCGDFGSQKDAQSVLRADPRDPNRLDADKDGIACENNALPRDMSPVPR